MISVAHFGLDSGTIGGCAQLGPCTAEKKKTRNTVHTAPVGELAQQEGPDESKGLEGLSS